MFGIRYCKTNPTDYVLHFSRGRLKREGAGLSFLYFRPSSTIVSVPLASVNIPFAFNEPTADFQILTVQGQLTYRIAGPKQASDMLDFSVDAGGRSPRGVRHGRFRDPGGVALRRSRFWCRS